MRTVRASSAVSLLLIASLPALAAETVKKSTLKVSSSSQPATAAQAAQSSQGGNSQATEKFFARLIRGSKPIPGLTLPTESLPVAPGEEKGRKKVFIQIQGRYSDSSRGLLVGEHPAKLKSDQKFEISVPIDGEQTSILVQAVDAKGQVTSENVVVEFEKYVAFSQIYKIEQPRGISIVPSLGVTYLQFSQTGLNDFSGILTTAKVSVSFPLGGPGSRWDAGANVFGNITSITEPGTGSSARFFGANLRAGYVLIDNGQWRLALLAGLSFSHMLVSGDSFGYSGLLYAQVFPTASYRLSSRSTAGAYLKYVPLSSVFGPQRELAGGLNYTYRLKNGKALQPALDLSSLQVGTSGTGIIQTFSCSLSLGYLL